MKELKNLNDLLNHKVQVLYEAEEMQVNALKRMAEQTSHKELKDVLQQHLKETETQKQRLEQAAKLLEIEPKSGETQGIQGLIAEGEKTLNKNASPETLNAAIIASVQSMEHYEIASYGTACYIAEELALMPVWEILSKNLQEEKATEGKLNNLAKSKVNVEAE
jgi:ferritin-like metal-binding protein YciE